MAKPLQQKKFNEVKRTIRDLKRVGLDKTNTVAKEHELSGTTVNYIRRAKSWGEYQEQLLSRGIKRIKTTPAEKQLAKSLEQLELNPVEGVTKKQFTDAIDSLKGENRNSMNRANSAHDRLDTHHKRLAGHSAILSRIQKLKPRWFPEKTS